MCDKLPWHVAALPVSICLQNAVNISLCHLCSHTGGGQMDPLQPLPQVHGLIVAKPFSHKPFELSAVEKTLVGAEFSPLGTDHTKIKELKFPDLKLNKKKCSVETDAFVELRSKNSTSIAFLLWAQTIPPLCPFFRV